MGGFRGERDITVQRPSGVLSQNGNWLSKKSRVWASQQPVNIVSILVCTCTYITVLKLTSIFKSYSSTPHPSTSRRGNLTIPEASNCPGRNTFSRQNKLVIFSHSATTITTILFIFEQFLPSILKCIFLPFLSSLYRSFHQICIWLKLQGPCHTTTLPQGITEKNLKKNIGKRQPVPCTQPFLHLPRVICI